jgi:hypothetical protein
MRVVRVIIGTLLVIVALPMLVAGGALWGAMQHRGADGAFTAQITPLSTGGYAIVAPGLDSLLRREASFTRGGQTTLTVAGAGREHLFVGIGPTADVERYLGNRPWARLTRVRLARGPLPVDIRQVPGTPSQRVAGADPQPAAAAGAPDAGSPGAPQGPSLAAPAAPPPDGGPVPNAAVAPNAAVGSDPGPAPNAAPGPDTAAAPDAGLAADAADASVSAALAAPTTLPFWLAVGQEVAGHETLSWSPSSMRDRDISLVVMNADGTPSVSTSLTATVNPRWLNPTTWGSLILGTVLFVLGSAALVWPRRHRDIVYVVEPSQLSEIAARLGVDTRSGTTAAVPARTAGVGAGIGAGRVHPAGVGPGTDPARSGRPLAAMPAPWFARVGGSPPHASSVATTGRQQARVTEVEPGADDPVPDEMPDGAPVADTWLNAEPETGAATADAGPDAACADAGPDEDWAGPPSLSWPPVRPANETPATPSPITVSGAVEDSAQDPERPRAPIKVTLDPFEVEVAPIGASDPLTRLGEARVRGQAQPISLS